MSWSDNKELSSRANTIDLNSLKKKKIYIYIGLMDIGLKYIYRLSKMMKINNNDGYRLEIGTIL